MAVAQSYDFQQQVRDMQANVDLILTKATWLFSV